MPEEPDILKILERDETLRRFVRINLDVLSLMAKAGHGEINCQLKECRLMVNRQRVILEGQ